jgi:hypothetical protein
MYSNWYMLYVLVTGSIVIGTFDLKLIVLDQINSYIGEEVRKQGSLFYCHQRTSHSEMPRYSLITHFTSLFVQIIIIIIINQ